MDKKIQLFLLEKFPCGSFYSALQGFIEECNEKGLSHATIARQYYNLHRIADGRHTTISNPPINDLTRSWLKEYVKTCWITYAPDTMRTMIGDIRQFFKWAKKEGHTTKNLAKPIKPVKTKQRRRRKAKAPPETDIYALLSETAAPLVNDGLLFKNIFGLLEVTNAPWPYTAVILLRDLFILTFIYETGCRAGELANLGSKAMNTATATRAPIYMITSIGKTNDQDYYFTNATAELWRIWQQVRPKENGRYAVVCWREWEEPRPMTTSTISKMLVRRCKHNDLRPFRAHSLRHAKTKRSRKLIGIELTSFLIGHADYQTTIGYDYIDDDELVEAVKKTGIQGDILHQPRSQNGHHPPPP